MYRKIIFIFVAFSLSSCTNNISTYFKRSANNKIFDTKGFQGGKRPPLYNKKYIAKAKQNVLEENFDDEDDDSQNDQFSESADPVKLNRQMYFNMLKKDANNRKQTRYSKFENSDYEANSNRYPSLNKAGDIANQSAHNEQELQRELTEIKAMLRETKADLSKYKCPMDRGSN